MFVRCNNRRSIRNVWIVAIIVSIGILSLLPPRKMMMMLTTTTTTTVVQEETKSLSQERRNSFSDPLQVMLPENRNMDTTSNNNAAAVQQQQQQEQEQEQCPIMKISQLQYGEQFPTKGKRHMVTPPSGGKGYLVCCTTTKGPLSILAHDQWAKRGAERFLDMVQQGYFSSIVPMMRCIRNFLCQFGISGNPTYTKLYDTRIDDDASWLPLGPNHRQNSMGIKRFAKGYLAYAGAGPNSRSNQFIVALQSNGPLGGGSPWEVPWGELVGNHSYRTLSRIYTGYGENGPTQALLRREGVTETIRNRFPKLDYITGCSLVDETVLLQEDEEEEDLDDEEGDENDEIVLKQTN